MMVRAPLSGACLYDSKSIFEDQLEAVEASSAKKGFDYVDLSLLTDGFEVRAGSKASPSMWPTATFATPKRKFIIADTPGHIQYNPQHGDRRLNGPT